MTHAIPAGLREAAHAVQAGALTSTQLVEHALAQIERCRDLNTIAFVDAARALREAAELDLDARSGNLRGPLHGVPVTVKDLFNVRGMPMRAGTRAPLPRITPEEAPAVEALRNAGAVILAKTNLQEIALGLNGENPWTGDVKNPHDPARQSGGSSSGSAASLGAGIAFGSLGSDTAGSIRLPASFCGVVGFKPSWGRVSLDGALPLIPSMDHAGPLARSVADVAMLFGVLTATPSLLPTPNPSPEGRGETVAWEGLREGISKPTLGIPRTYLEGALTAEVQSAFHVFVQHLKKRGAKIIDIELDVANAADAFLPLRADSVIVHRAALETNPDAFAPYVRDTLLRGYEFKAVDYLAARQQQRQMRESIHRSLAGVDALLLPASPCVAPLRGETEVELESGRHNVRLAILKLCAPFSFAGVPALSLPFAQIAGLPVNAQVITPFGEDARTLQIGQWVEKANTPR
jgi:aspartyl-tRNA(Asn)/glutamyl-tRNA(Gln) amidotransferase subunit A